MDKKPEGQRPNPEMLQKTLIDTIAEFPNHFRLEDHKGTFTIIATKSRIDPETGEESLGVFARKGNEIGEFLGEFSQRDLASMVIEDEPDDDDEVDEKKPKKRERESHIDLARRLMLAKATPKQQFLAFKKAFEDNRKSGHENKLDDQSVRRRIYFYRWQASTRFTDVMELVNGGKMAKLQERMDKLRESMEKAKTNGNGAATTPSPVPEPAKPAKGKAKSKAKKATKASAKAPEVAKVKAESDAIAEAAKRPLKAPKKH